MSHTRRFLLSALACIAFASSVSIFAAPFPDPPATAPAASAPAVPDFTALPPTPEEVEKTVASSKVSLAQAIDIAQKHLNGIASSATMHLSDTPPTLNIVVYAGGKANFVLVDAVSGKVISTVVIPHLPGEETTTPAVERPNGLKIYELKTGDGEEVKDGGAVVQAHLSAWLVNGMQVFSTRGEGKEPAAIPLASMTQILSGLQEGFTGMKVGGRRKLIMPAKLAYGVQGQPPAVPANATLICDIELLAINPFEKIPDHLPGDPITGDPVTTASGLKYYDIKVGQGEQPADKHAMVKVHYTGYLTDGKTFDSSVQRGQPAQFPLDGVIPGWTEGVGSMKVGGKRKLLIPYNLGYGEQGSQGIPPKATLIFDVELLEIVKPPASGAGGDPTGTPNPANPKDPGR